MPPCVCQRRHRCGPPLHPSTRIGQLTAHFPWKCSSHKHRHGGRLKPAICSTSEPSRSWSRRICGSRGALASEVCAPRRGWPRWMRAGRNLVGFCYLWCPTRAAANFRSWAWTQDTDLQGIGTVENQHFCIFSRTFLLQICFLKWWRASRKFHPVSYQRKLTALRPFKTVCALLGMRVTTCGCLDRSWHFHQKGRFGSINDAQRRIFSLRLKQVRRLNI